MEEKRKKHRVQEEERLQNGHPLPVEIEEDHREFVLVELVEPVPVELVNVVDDLYLLKEGVVNRGEEDEAINFPQGEDKYIVVSLYHCDDTTYKTRYESLRRYYN